MRRRRCPRRRHPRDRGSANPRRHPLARKRATADSAEPPVPVERHLLVHVLPRGPPRPRRIEARHLHRTARQRRRRRGPNRRGAPSRRVRLQPADPQGPSPPAAHHRQPRRRQNVRRRPGHPPRHRRRPAPPRRHLATHPRQPAAPTPPTQHPGVVGSRPRPASPSLATHTARACAASATSAASSHWSSAIAWGRVPSRRHPR